MGLTNLPITAVGPGKLAIIKQYLYIFLCDQQSLMCRAVKVVIVWVMSVTCNDLIVNLKDLVTMELLVFYVL